jgi:CheY-like chemotaxis protein
MDEFSERADAGSASKRPGPAHGRGLVLIVDDDVTLLKLLDTILDDEGYRVVTARTLTEAADALGRLRCDLVLADTMGAPVSSGGLEDWAPLEQLREVAGATPVVLMTGHRGEAVAEYAAHGFHDLLLKPFELEDLLALVARLVPELTQGNDPKRD